LLRIALTVAISFSLSINQKSDLPLMVECGEIAEFMCEEPCKVLLH
jgi:hypothetical protein